MGEINQVPVQVCKRACGFWQSASREWIPSTGRWGRVRVEPVPRFTAEHCPRCGAALVSRCANENCRAYIIDVADSHCRACGALYPWRPERQRGRLKVLGRNWQRAAVEICRADGSGKHDGSHRFWVFDWDIAAIGVDAVVSNDNPNGEMTSGAAWAIKAACGAQVEEESVARGPYEPGSAWDTEPGALGVKRVIHVASVRRDGSSDLALVGRVTTAALELANLLRLRSLALPAIGSGTAALSTDDCITAIATAATSYFRAAPSTSLMDVVLVLFSPRSLDESVLIARRAAEKALAQATGGG